MARKLAKVANVAAVWRRSIRLYACCHVTLQPHYWMLCLLLYRSISSKVTLAFIHWTRTHIHTHTHTHAHTHTHTNTHTHAHTHTHTHTHTQTHIHTHTHAHTHTGAQPVADWKGCAGPPTVEVKIVCRHTCLNYVILQAFLSVTLIASTTTWSQAFSTPFSMF
jgi:hypothetical protein